MALGASDTISVVVRLSLVQLRTPDEMLGRVSAVNSLSLAHRINWVNSNRVSTAGWWGARTAVLVGGIATITVALLWMKLFPELRNTRSLEREEELVAEQAAERRAAWHGARLSFDEKRLFGPAGVAPRLMRVRLSALLAECPPRSRFMTLLDSHQHVYPSDIAFTPTVKALQSRNGSRDAYARMEEEHGWQTRSYA